MSADAGDIGHIIGDLMEQFGRVLGLSARFQPPMWVPTPANRRLRKTSRRIDTLILGIIDARKRSEETRDDLLSLLIRARDEAGGQMTDAQVRDEAVILFLAGHETTALALTLRAVPAGDASRSAGAPGRRDRSRRSADAAPGSATWTSWPCTETVVLESMRLYPPAWGIGRQARDARRDRRLRVPARARSS